MSRALFFCARSLRVGFPLPPARRPCSNPRPGRACSPLARRISSPRARPHGARPFAVNQDHLICSAVQVLQLVQDGVLLAPQLGPRGSLRRSPCSLRRIPVPLCFHGRSSLPLPVRRRSSMAAPLARPLRNTPVASLRARRQPHPGSWRSSSLVVGLVSPSQARRHLGTARPHVFSCCRPRLASACARQLPCPRLLSLPMLQLVGLQPPLHPTPISLWSELTNAHCSSTLLAVYSLHTHLLLPSPWHG